MRYAGPGSSVTGVGWLATLACDCPRIGSPTRRKNGDAIFARRAPFQAGVACGP